MPSQVTNYQCPACNAPLRFDEKSGELACDHCGSTFSAGEIEEYYKNKDAAAAGEFEKAEEQQEQDSFEFSEGESDWGEEEKNVRFYSCPSCGASLMLDNTTAATKCPYCGNPSIVPGQFSGEKKPDFVIPFAMTIDEAKEKLKEHYKGKPFLPKTFSEQNHIDEIQGVYVPFWLYSGEANASAQFHATRSFTMRQGDYMVTRTNHFSVRRAGVIPFDKIPADASKNMPDNYMDAIEPFDYSKLKEFSTAYLPGFVAHRYDVTPEENAPRVDERIKNSAISLLRSTISGYQTVTPTGCSVRVSDGKVQYALLPVWILHTKWNDGDYMFAMNGQTGKMVSTLPTSVGKFFARFVTIAVPVAALVALVLYFIG